MNKIKDQQTWIRKIPIGLGQIIFRSMNLQTGFNKNPATLLGYKRLRHAWFEVHQGVQKLRKKQ